MLNNTTHNELNQTSSYRPVSTCWIVQNTIGQNNSLQMYDGMAYLEELELDRLYRLRLAGDLDLDLERDRDLIGDLLLGGDLLLSLNLGGGGERRQPGPLRGGLRLGGGGGLGREMGARTKAAEISCPSI